jgi:hypothetical protein
MEFVIFHICRLGIQVGTYVLKFASHHCISNLIGLVTTMTKVFGQDPPVRSTQPAPPRNPIPNPYTLPPKPQV